MGGGFETSTLQSPLSIAAESLALRNFDMALCLATSTQTPPFSTHSTCKETFPARISPHTVTMRSREGLGCAAESEST